MFRVCECRSMTEEERITIRLFRTRHGAVIMQRPSSPVRLRNMRGDGLAPVGEWTHKVQVMAENRRRTRQQRDAALTPLATEDAPLAKRRRQVEPRPPHPPSPLVPPPRAFAVLPTEDEATAGKEATTAVAKAGEETKAAVATKGRCRSFNNTCPTRPGA